MKISAAAPEPEPERASVNICSIESKNIAAVMFLLSARKIWKAINASEKCAL
jgi:hypothetical protein